MRFGGLPGYDSDGASKSPGPETLTDPADQAKLDSLRECRKLDDALRLATEVTSAAAAEVREAMDAMRAR